MQSRCSWAVTVCMACCLALALGQATVRAEDGETGDEKTPGSIKGKLNSPYAKLADGVVYIKEVKGRKFHLPEENPKMDQKNKMFLPLILPVMVKSIIDFPNSDDVRHSVYTREGSANTFTLGQYDVGVVKHVTLDQVGVTHLGCNVHTEMSGYILTLQNPFFAIAKRKDRLFMIADVPPGVYELTFFHEKIESVTLEAIVEPGKETYVEFTKLKRKR